VSRPPRDDEVVRRSARRVAVQAAALVAAALLLVIGLAAAALVRDQAAATDRQLRTTASTADDAGDPPAGTWLALERGDGVQTTAGLPSVLVAPLAHLRSGARPQVRLQTLRFGDDVAFRVATERRPQDVVQAVADLRVQYAQRDALLRAIGGAAALALVAAGGLGTFFGTRAVRPLSQALHLQRRFVADASHELRTPLTLLSTRAQLLAGEIRRVTDDGQVLADTDGVLSDVRRLTGVVDDLLVAADPRGDGRWAPVDIVELVAGAVSSAAAHAQAVGVRLETDVPRVPAVVVGSEVALRRAVLALVDNAVDHTPPGGEVRLTVTSGRRRVVLSVSDTGPGIPPGDAPRVVGRFSSGGQRAGRAHYGLGLALTHDVASRHGGRLRLADPGPGQGATFEVILPAAPAAQSPS
jgi:signal transduction histidine kinase